MEITKSMVNNLLELLNQGINEGGGTFRRKGDFCVQQAVNRATTQVGKTDHPQCVQWHVCEFGISLNDSYEGPDKRRAKILKRFAVAELGSAGTIDGFKFQRRVEEKWRKICPGQSYEHSFYSHNVKKLADIAVDVLIEMGSPGTKYLYMCEPGAKLKPEHKKATLSVNERNKYMQITDKIVSKLLGLIDQGLCHGAGDWDGPGDFCVQQAVHRATTEHGRSDRPLCVLSVVRQLGIWINDRFIGDSKERAKLLKKFAVAELGSSDLNGNAFRKQMADKWNKKYPDRKIVGYEYIMSDDSNSNLCRIVDTAIEVLTEMGSPGASYLYMCEPGAQLKPEHKKELEKAQKFEEQLNKLVTWKEFGKPVSSCKTKGTNK